MKEFLCALRAHLQGGQPAVLCTILESSGSTPRGAGTMMAVLPDGSILGTVGGGSVEYAAIARALRRFDESGDALEHYTLSSGQAADLGMICGGNQSLYFRLLRPADAELFARAAALYDQRTDSWLVTRLCPGGEGELDLYTREGFLYGRFDAPDAASLPRRKPLLENGVFIQPLSRSEMVYVFGGGHVSRALVPLLATVDFSVTVYDDRPEFAAPEAFPTAQGVLCAPYDALFDHIDPQPNDYAVVMTRGHEGDYLVQKQLLSRPLHYIGVIGSRRKAATQRQALLSDGFDEAALSVIRSPVGLSIGAQTPAEIAVSVAAELIKLRSENA